MKISANSLKIGNIIVQDGRLMLIAKAPEHVKPGKGPAYVQLELKDIKTKTKTVQRISSSDYLEKAHLEQREYQFLYQDEKSLFFMGTQDFEQIELDKSDFDKGVLAFLQDGMLIKIDFFEDDPINFILPSTVTLEISETDPVIKGATASSSYKPALLENGVTIKVPPYLNIGDKVVVKTEDSSFVERVK